MKSKYETHIEPHLEKIKEWAEGGMTKAEIAKRLDVANSTFRKFCALGEQGDERYTALSEALTRACAVADTAVENALFRSATGYKEQVLKHYKVKVVDYDPVTGKRVSEREELREAYDEVAFPANVAAQQFWLTNRQPDRWQYKPEAAATDTGESGIVMMPEILPEENRDAE